MKGEGVRLWAMGSHIPLASGTMIALEQAAVRTASHSPAKPFNPEVSPPVKKPGLVFDEARYGPHSALVGSRSGVFPNGSSH